MSHSNYITPVHMADKHKFLQDPHTLWLIVDWSSAKDLAWPNFCDKVIYSQI